MAVAISFISLALHGSLGRDSEGRRRLKWWSTSICLVGDWRWRSVEGLDRCHSSNVLQ